jgi:hypothetical protein
MKIRFLFFVVISLLLAACGPAVGAFTPEDAALNDLSNSAMRPMEGQIVTDSVEVRQSVQVENSVFVLLTYQRTIENRQENCRMTYQTERRLGRWTVGAAGGGCEGFVDSEGSEPPPPSDLSIGAGQSSSGPMHPGYSHVEGFVNNLDITQVRVTWEDRLVETVNVVNETFLTARTGQLRYESVEGLNTAGEVVYSSNPVVAPEKQEP